MLDECVQPSLKSISCSAFENPRCIGYPPELIQIPNMAIFKYTGLYLSKNVIKFISLQPQLSELSLPEYDPVIIKLNKLRKLYIKNVNTIVEAIIRMIKKNDVELVNLIINQLGRLDVNYG